MANNMKINATFSSNDSNGRASESFTLKSLSNSSLIRWETSEDVVFELRSDSDKEFRKTIKNNDITTFIEGDDLYIANPTSSATQADGFTITATACLTCVEFDDAATAIGKINPYAFLNSVSSKRRVEDDDTPHAQGSNLYIDINKRRHFIVSYDTRRENECGYLVIFSEPTCDKITPRIMEVECNNKIYNHPGSFQIVGDFLFLPVEEYRGSEKGRKDGVEVHVYDLTPLAEEGGVPNEIAWCTVGKGETKHKGGALGATDEWIAINDQENLYLYKYKIADGKNVEGFQLNMEYVDSFKIEKTQGIGLIKQLPVGALPNTRHEVLYLLGLVTTSKNEDRIYYYKILITTDTEDDRTTSSKVEVDDRPYIHVWTEPGNGKHSKDSIHLKYGGGVYLSDNDTISCLGTGREIRTDMKFNFNIFSNIDRVELDCALENIKDTEPRASQNFSILNFAHDYCRFHVYDENGKEVTPTLLVRRDIKKKDDKNIRKVSYDSVMAVRTGDYDEKDEDLDKTPMYLAYDTETTTMSSSESKGFLRVVIEGVTKDGKK